MVGSHLLRVLSLNGEPVAAVDGERFAYLFPAGGPSGQVFSVQAPCDGGQGAATDEGVGHERRMGLCHRLTIRLEHMSEKGSVVERAFPLTPDGAQYSFTSSQERSVPKDASVSSIHGM